MDYLKYLKIYDIIRLKEAFYSCQIEGINEHLTFEQWLRTFHSEMITKNKFIDAKTGKGIKPQELAKRLEGENKYIGDYFLPDMMKTATFFHNTNPNTEKGHKEYPFLYFEFDGTLMISALDKEKFEKIRKHKL